TAHVHVCFREPSARPRRPAARNQPDTIRRNNASARCASTPTPLLETNRIRSAGTTLGTAPCSPWPALSPSARPWPESTVMVRITAFGLLARSRGRQERVPRPIAEGPQDPIVHPGSTQLLPRCALN